MDTTAKDYGEFYYYPAIDGQGFDVLSGMGVNCKLHCWRQTEEQAIMEFRKRYIASLQASLKSAATYAQMKSALQHCLGMMREAQNGLHQHPNVQRYVLELIEMYKPLVEE